MYLIRQLDDSEITAFMNEVYELPTKRDGTPPTWGYGPYIAKITYENGDVEMLGSYNIEFIPSGSTPTGIGDYIFPRGVFQDVFLKYAGLSEVSPTE